MAAMRRNQAVELFWKLHPRVYRWTGGRVLGRVLGMPVLLLTTTGRRSGRSRTTALTYLEDDGRCVVVASKLGEPTHPAWYHNLRAQPLASIQVGREIRSVRARDAEGDERERLWRRVCEQEPSYAEYAARTDRPIPVVVLE